jgi:tetratricopeptide (TPR) repeat protein
MLPSRHLSVGMYILFAVLYLATYRFGYAQAPTADATVNADALAVHAETNESSGVVRSLKKGDAILLGIEVQTSSGTWCSIRLPDHTERLGYVPCDGLERKPVAAPSASPFPTRASGDTTLIGANSSRPALPPALARALSQASAEYARIEAQVVPNGILDGPKIEEFERDAKGGSSEAMARAALAHVIASKFEISHGDYDMSIEQARAALPFTAKAPPLKLAVLALLSYDSLARGEYSAALEYLNQARKIEPNAAPLMELTGEAYYGMGRIDDAVKMWQSAQQIAPSAEVAALLEKAQRDQTAETGSSERESTHFLVRYQGSATPQLATEILRTLDEHFQALVVALDFTPTEPISVVLYTQQAFRDTTRVPGWAGALNDGRIRVPVEGINSVTPELSRILKHELTHSFVHQISLGRCPTWLNEGLAQWMEGSRSEQSAKYLVAAYDRGQFIPLDRLEGSWMNFPAPAAGYAYAWSLGVTEYIMSRSGPWGMQRLLASFKTASYFEGALGAALQTNYADLQRQTVDYLRQTYPH